MKVKILCFGISRDIVGKSMFEVEIPKDANVGSLMNKLKTHYPDLNRLTSLAIAVNSEYVKENYLIQENDEVALIPPVSGG